ncbi:hypothetical protein ACJ41O_013094 [Fusarium nematophilum]
MKLAVWSLPAVVGVLSPLVAGDWQYRSRPDLTPPRLNITVPSKHGLVEEGFIFVAPYPGPDQGPVQPAAYIFRDDGDLVWSGLSFFAGGVANFRVDTWNGQQVLSAFQGQNAETIGRAYGYHSLLNSRYEVIKVVRGLSHKLTSAHEFHIVDGRTALAEIGSTLPIGLSRWGGTEGQDWIVSTGFQELDVETSRVLFEWESIDHVDPKYSIFPLSEGRNTSTAWDYFHLNSVEKDDQGNYIISARHTSAIYKINGTTGGIVWTLGGLASSFKVDPETAFAYQHDARLLHRSDDGNVEILSLFDNAASHDHHISPFSRGRIIQLNHETKTAKALHTYNAPDGISAQSQGNAQVLPNGNVFVNWGQAGAVTEFSQDGDVLFHAYVDSAPVGRLVQNYRGFRFNWTGIPSEEPAVVAIRSKVGGAVGIYVSWNGDTETAIWRFYAKSISNPIEQRERRETLLGEVKRTGFETRLGVESADLDHSLVFVEAVDVRGEVLRRSPAVVVSQGLPEPPASSGSLETQTDVWGEL